MNAFDAQAEVVGELFAAHAAIALIGSTRQAEWQTELGSRDIIGMAKGILMHRERITDDQAFTLLLSTAQKANIKIHDLAVWLVDDAQQHPTPTRLTRLPSAICEFRDTEGAALRLSEAGVRTIRRAHAVQPVAAVQSEYSVWTRDPERNGVLDTCEELGIGFVPWGPVGLGYLTGKIDARARFDPQTDLRSRFPRFTPEALAANMPVVDLMKRFAAEEGRHTCPDRTGMAAGAKAVHRSHPRHPQHRSPDRKPRSTQRCADARGPSGDRQRLRQDHRARCTDG